MSLATLYNIPRSPQALEEFLIANEAEHNEVITQISTQKQQRLTILPIRPLFTADLSGWLARHQILHDNANSALNLGSNDLLVLSFDNADQLANWIWLHSQEHRQWRSTLKI